MKKLLVVLFSVVSLVANAQVYVQTSNDILLVTETSVTSVNKVLEATSELDQFCKEHHDELQAAFDSIDCAERAKYMEQIAALDAQITDIKSIAAPIKDSYNAAKSARRVECDARNAFVLDAQIEDLGRQLSDYNVKCRRLTEERNEAARQLAYINERLGNN